jgi:hypothetical protein
MTNQAFRSAPALALSASIQPEAAATWGEVADLIARELAQRGPAAVHPQGGQRCLGIAARLAIRELQPPPASPELDDEDEVTSLYSSSRRSFGDLS